MNWVDAIEARLKAATPGHSPEDIAKLIAAVRVANKALREIGFHDCDGDGMPTDEAFADIKGIASKAETQLQSGEFPKEDA